MNNEEKLYNLLTNTINENKQDITQPMIFSILFGLIFEILIFSDLSKEERQEVLTETYQHIMFELEKEEDKTC